jgi:predicted DNA-binding transcriptional regulator AlpA
MSDHDTYPEIMTSEQAMSFLQMGRSAFYKALRAGEIPCRRLSQRMIRFHRETLSTWIAGGAIPAAHRSAPQQQRTSPSLEEYDQQETPAPPSMITRNDNGRVPGTTMNGEQRAEAKRIYLANVNSGQPLKEAAIEAGVTMGAVRNWRDSDKAFETAEAGVRN